MKGLHVDSEKPLLEQLRQPIVQCSNVLFVLCLFFHLCSDFAPYLFCPSYHHTDFGRRLHLLFHHHFTLSVLHLKVFAKMAPQGDAADNRPAKKIKADDGLQHEDDSEAHRIFRSHPGHNGNRRASAIVSSDVYAAADSAKKELTNPHLLSVNDSPLSNTPVPPVSSTSLTELPATASTTVTLNGLTWVKVLPKWATSKAVILVIFTLT